MLAVGRRRGFEASVAPSAAAMAASGLAAEVSYEGRTDWQLADGHYVESTIPLTLIAPREGLTTNSAYYKAYPGLNFRRPIGVIGGAWPYRFELVQSPAGMSITETLPSNWLTDGLQNYGLIEWSNPTAGTHTIEVRVTDQVNNSVTATWTLTVETSGFIFVDATNGNDANSGTISSPKQSWAGVHGSTVGDSTYDNYHVIWRAGTYETADAPISLFSGTSQSIRLTTSKPQVHIAYPGETVTWDTSGACLEVEAADTAFIGIIFEGLSALTHYMTVRLNSVGPDRVLVSECTFQNQSAAGVAGQNPAHFAFRNGSGFGVHQYFFASRCRFIDVQNVLCFEMYGADQMLVEGCEVQNITGADARFVYAKMYTSDLQVRANRGLTGIRRPLLNVDTYQALPRNEACWNSWRTQSGDLMIEIGRNPPNALGSVYLNRNTFVGGYIEHRGNVSGTITYANNVVQHDGTYTNGIRIVGTDGTTLTGVSSNLAATEGLVDSSNLLTGDARDDYLGTKGHEVA